MVPCLLLALPAGLRNRIYEYTLAPTGLLNLTSFHTRCFAVVPHVSPRLLATCKQIHHEASRILYAENEICFTVSAYDTCWPLISEARIPQFALQRMERVLLILNCEDYFQASYKDLAHLTCDPIYASDGSAWLTVFVGRTMNNDIERRAARTWAGRRASGGRSDPNSRI